MSESFNGGDAGYTWGASQDPEYPDTLVARVSGPWMVDSERRLKWRFDFSYTRYTVTIQRVTEPQLRRLPRLTETVSLVDASSQSLLQPKDWGKRRVDLTYRDESFPASVIPFDWSDIKPLRPFFAALHPIVRGCYANENFLPLVDFLAGEADVPLFSPFFAQPGDLKL